MSEKNTGIVSFTLDLDNPPTMTPEQEARFAAIRDEDIDFSDLPPQGHRTDWVRGGLKERIAQRIAANQNREARAEEERAVHLDADVLSFFKETGDASAGRINAVLREYAEAHRKSA